MEDRQKKYIGIAKALFAYAVQISLDAGFDGVLVFKAKTSELLNYYMNVCGARQVPSHDPFAFGDLGGCRNGSFIRFHCGGAR